MPEQRLRTREVHAADGVLLPTLAGGALAGTLDILGAFVVYGLRGIAPARILQSIASGL